MSRQVVDIVCIKCAKRANISNLFSTNCGHVFHNDCIKDGLETQLRCPQCLQTNISIQKLHFNLKDSDKLIKLEAKIMALMENEEKLKHQIQLLTTDSKSRLCTDFLEPIKLNTRLENEKYLFQTELENQVKQLKIDILINETEIKKQRNESCLLEQKLAALDNDYKLLSSKGKKNYNKINFLKKEIELMKLMQTNPVTCPEMAQLQQLYDEAQNQIRIVKRKKNRIKINSIRVNGNIRQLQYQIRKLNEENEFLNKSLQSHCTELEEIVKEQETVYSENESKLKELKSNNTTKSLNLPSYTETRKFSDINCSEIVSNENETKLMELDWNNITISKTSTILNNCPNATFIRKLSETKLKDLPSIVNTTFKPSVEATPELKSTYNTEILDIENESKFKESKSKSNPLITSSSETTEFEETDSRKIVANNNKHKPPKLQSKNATETQLETNYNTINSIDTESILKDLSSENDTKLKQNPDDIGNSRPFETNCSTTVSNDSESNLKNLQSLQSTTLSPSTDGTKLRKMSNRSEKVSNSNKFKSIELKSLVASTLEPCPEITQVPEATYNNEIVPYISGLQNAKERHIWGNHIQSATIGLMIAITMLLFLFLNYNIMALCKK